MKNVVLLMIGFFIGVFVLAVDPLDKSVDCNRQSFNKLAEIPDDVDVEELSYSKYFAEYRAVVVDQYDVEYAGSSVNSFSQALTFAVNQYYKASHQNEHAQ